MGFEPTTPTLARLCCARCDGHGRRSFEPRRSIEALITPRTAAGKAMLLIRAHPRPQARKYRTIFRLAQVPTRDLAIEFVGYLIFKIPFRPAGLNKLSRIFDGCCCVIVRNAPDEVIIGDHSIRPCPTENHTRLTQIARFGSSQISIVLYNVLVTLRCISTLTDTTGGEDHGVSFGRF